MMTDEQLKEEYGFPIAAWLVVLAALDLRIVHDLTGRSSSPPGWALERLYETLDVLGIAKEGRL